ncbi:MAG: HTH domain-containing protein [Bacteroidales bacterium]|jgi:DNA-binding MurR/RpiR family transcriptional regulator|nr:HTH domain-containing protein [Bacteroidales bacterium]
MSKLDLTENFVVMERLIRKKSTGTSKQLAKRLSVSQATVFRMIKEFNIRGAEVDFCNFCNSYFYSGDKVINIHLNISNMTEEEMRNTNGGEKIFSFFLHHYQI